MKRAGGGFDDCYNAQAAVDDMAHRIIAAELTNSGADSRQLPAVLAAVKANTGDDPHQGIADAGYRSEAIPSAHSKIASARPPMMRLKQTGR